MRVMERQRLRCFRFSDMPYIERPLANRDDEPDNHDKQEADANGCHGDARIAAALVRV